MSNTTHVRQRMNQEMMATARRLHKEGKGILAISLILNYPNLEAIHRCVDKAYALKVKRQWQARNRKRVAKPQ